MSLFRRCISRQKPPVQFAGSGKNTDYLDVLRRYLLTECSIQQTAEQMQVHRNTINYKLRQIREILQTDLNQEARVKIYLAYLIRDML